ncbi:MAG: uracil-DNA glycosylase [Pseudomonadota bacterium]
MEKGLTDVLGHLKKLLNASMEMGLEPPSLSPSSLDYLRRGALHQNTLEELRAIIGDCRRCKLWHGRANLVFGEGTPQARLVFVGEGPGKEEDLEGKPFVGEAGRLLTRIIHAMGLTREEVYICNVVKCRPPNNRDPEEDEIRTCIPFLRKQLDLIRPQVICALGRVAARGLLEKEIKITQERGKWQSYEGIPVMPTYHPAYLIRNPSAKRPVWEDVQKIMTLLGMEVKKND